MGCFPVFIKAVGRISLHICRNQLLKTRLDSLFITMQLILIKGKLTEEFASILRNKVLRLSLSGQSVNLSGNRFQARFWSCDHGLVSER